MTTHNDDDTPNHELIAGLIDAGDDSLDTAAVGLDDAPHPALGGYPYGGQGEDDVIPADDERPEDADQLSRTLIAECSHQPQNDTGNGKRLLTWYGVDLLHVRSVGWHAWAGTHWEGEGGHEILMRCCQRTAARIVLEADVMSATPTEQRAIDAAADAKAEAATLDKRGTALTAEEKDKRRRLQTVIDAGAFTSAQLLGRQNARRKYAISSGNDGKIKGMINQAAPHRTVKIDDLDADKLAFNVANGTLHFVFDEVPDPDAPEHAPRMLKRYRAELREHNRADHMTKVAPIDYVEGATCPKFDEAITRFQPIEPVRKFLQRYHGYSLTGLTGEQCLVFDYGTGSNWKSTFVEIVARVMGPYCATIAFESLAGDQQRSGSQATPDLARLPGARLVRASEPERGVQFKEALIKSLTGGEPMLVRSLNKEFFEFRPDFKLVLSGNHKPEIGGVDHGIWRRIKFVPWPVTIADHEKRPMDEVLAELWAERSGILNWLVEGCLDWLNGGLQTPQEVIDATASYREEMDPVGAFVGQCVSAVPSNPNGSAASTVAARAMYDAFAAWANANAVRPWKEKSFAVAMSQKGFAKERHREGVRYLHVVLTDVPAGPARRREEAPHPADDDAVPV